MCSGQCVSSQVAIKDTASYLLNAFKNVTGERETYKNGMLDHRTYFTMTQFSLDNCTLNAIVKMKEQMSNGQISTYTLTYSIPFKDIDEVTTTKSKDSSGIYKKGALHFGMPYNVSSIHYTFTDDLTERVEANGLYAHTDLWCKEEEVARVIEVLNDLRKRCFIKKNTYNFSN